MSSAFHHRHAAHCESGVISSMLCHAGLEISEPMAFGLSNALSFAYLPMIKLSGMPLIAYRLPPRSIIKGLQRRVGFKMRFSTFRDPAKGMQALDTQLQQGNIVGLQTSIFWLPYVPEDMRFHFNAHNLIVYGKQGNDYQISDPVFETSTLCEGSALQKARFAKGALAAKGLMYYPEQVPKEIDYDKAIPAAIKWNYRVMNHTPLPMIGVGGIRYLGKQIVKASLRDNADQHLPLYLTHIIRMQEEIGTGGAGFRFIYASFLKQSANILQQDLLHQASHEMAEAGDQWRLFALTAAKMCKGRKAMDAALLAEQLNLCADREAAAWQLLKRF